MSLPIESSRLILRRFTYSDIADLIEFVSHPSVAQEVGELGNTEAKVKEYIDMQNSFKPFEKEKIFDLAIELKATGKLIGLLTLITKHHRKGEIGYALGIDYRKKGYATEAARALIDYAFAELNYHRVQAIASSGKDAVEKYEAYLPGHTPIPMAKVVNGYVKRVLGKGTGEIIRMYDNS